MRTFWCFQQLFSPHSSTSKQSFSLSLTPVSLMFILENVFQIMSRYTPHPSRPSTTAAWTSPSTAGSWTSMKLSANTTASSLILVLPSPHVRPTPKDRTSTGSDPSFKNSTIRRAFPSIRCYFICLLSIFFCLFVFSLSKKLDGSCNFRFVVVS